MCRLDYSRDIGHQLFAAIKLYPMCLGCFSTLKKWYSHDLLDYSRDIKQVFGPLGLAHVALRFYLCVCYLLVKVVVMCNASFDPYLLCLLLCLSNPKHLSCNGVGHVMCVCVLVWLLQCIFLVLYTSSWSGYPYRVSS